MWCDVVQRGTTKTLQPPNPRGFQPGAVFLLGVAQCDPEWLRITTWTAGLAGGLRFDSCLAHQ